jgi:hypothetical protein
MRSSPIIIGLAVTVMCISVSWAEKQQPRVSKAKLLVQQAPKDVEESRQQIQRPKSEKPGPDTIALPVYKPPKRGAPGGRVGGATRGNQETYLNVEVLAPEKVRGLTSQDQPELYWYLSTTTTVPIEFTLIDEEATEPLVETRLPQTATAGLQRVQLADFGIHLRPDRMYRWSIALIIDNDHRSKDILAGARIQQALPSEIPTAKLTGADALQATFINAQAGLWYDAVASISQAIQSAPHQAHYHDVRAALLEQVGLGDIATIDRKRVAGF